VKEAVPIRLATLPEMAQTDASQWTVQVQSGQNCRITGALSMVFLSCWKAARASPVS
jgi:hypothetical protein